MVVKTSRQLQNQIIIIYFEWPQKTYLGLKLFSEFLNFLVELEYFFFGFHGSFADCSALVTCSPHQV